MLSCCDTPPAVLAGRGARGGRLGVSPGGYRCQRCSAPLAHAGRAAVALPFHTVLLLLATMGEGGHRHRQIFSMRTAGYVSL